MVDKPNFGRSLSPSFPCSFLLYQSTPYECILSHVQCMYVCHRRPACQCGRPPALSLTFLWLFLPQSGWGKASTKIGPLVDVGPKGGKLALTPVRPGPCVMNSRGRQEGQARHGRDQSRPKRNGRNRGGHVPLRSCRAWIWLQVACLSSSTKSRYVRILLVIQLTIYLHFLCMQPGLVHQQTK